MPPNHCPGGFSLIACLIANGLALALVASLFSASADLLVAVRESSLRSDQVLRARQFFLFVSEALSSAKIPEQWVPGGAWGCRHVFLCCLAVTPPAV